jgi:hypothetical protein
LRDNIKEYFDSAERDFSEKKFNVATTSYFKAICAGADLIIYLKTHEVPSSHTNRFKILKEKFPDIYDIVDRDFPFYQDSYTKKLDKESAEVLKKDAGRIKKMSEN